MTGMTVELDGIRLTTINMAELQFVDVSVHGALDQNPKARLSANGGNYSDGGCGHLIWIPEDTVRAGKVVKVTLTDSCSIADKGKTVQELFPDDPVSTRTDFSINDELAAELRARPLLHEEFTVRAETSDGQYSIATSDEKNTNFTFGILWDWARPAQARVRFRTHCLEDVLARRLGASHLDATISIGDSASFTLIS
jgi:hypothetical protein